ncbi:MAG TPA: hypothetical protein VFN30_09680 [Chitinophagaceae bacterium]|nr:hypothetical protein [Chitinophagaceae bacterium]
MKKGSLFFTLLLSISIANSQSLDEIINKHINALGGKDKIKAVKTVHMEGVIIGQNGNEINVNIWKEHNKLYRREINFGAGVGVQLITDKGGWNTDRQGVFNPMPEDIYKKQLYQMDCEGPLVDYTSKGHQVELIGKETVDTKDFYKLKVTLNSGQEQFYYIDAVTFYIDHIKFKAGGFGGRNANPDAEITISFSNYDKTSDGFVFPFTTSTGGGFGGSLNFEKIEVNVPLEEKLYKGQ